MRDKEFETLKKLNTVFLADEILEPFFQTGAETLFEQIERITESGMETTRKGSITLFTAPHLGRLAVRFKPAVAADYFTDRPSIAERILNSKKLAILQTIARAPFGNSRMKEAFIGNVSGFALSLSHRDILAIGEADVRVIELAISATPSAPKPKEQKAGGLPAAEIARLFGA